MLIVTYLHSISVPYYVCQVYHYYLQQLQEALSSGPDAQKQKLAEVSRKITILRVNEKALSRRYTLMHESEAALKKVLTGTVIFTRG